ncbi:hypothetical protein BGZ74_010505 [Mortierella antarctica]|nr:hypothetical protein BGZ74_010505 [Mortierella antarctica]
MDGVFQSTGQAIGRTDLDTSAPSRDSRTPHIFRPDNDDQYQPYYHQPRPTGHSPESHYTPHPYPTLQIQTGMQTHSPSKRPLLLSPLLGPEYPESLERRTSSSGHRSISYYHNEQQSQHQQLLQHERPTHEPTHAREQFLHDPMERATPPRTHSPSHPMLRPSSSPSSFPSSTSSSSSIPMPHFRGQLLHRAPDSAYQRKYLGAPGSGSGSSPTPPSSTSSTVLVPIHAEPLSKMPRKASTSKRPQPNDTIGTASTVHPRLESVLVELFNGMLMSHNALATREHISSQEQPMVLRPVMIQSLDHLAALMAHAPSVSSSGIPATMATSAPGATRKKAPPHPPSRLSQSIYFSDTERDTDSDLDLDRGAQGADTTRREATEGTTGRSSGPPHPESELLAMDIEAAEMYTSTIEFLSLMTAFVSVVCWLMQARLKRNTSHTDSTLGMDEDVDMENRQPVDKDCFERLHSFLLFFDDHDNVLKPIQDALYLEEQQSSHSTAHSRGTDDPTRQVGLFAWHYSLFSGDEDGPLQQEVSLIDRQALDSIHFDVILNDLYSTHVLAMTAKEHQKDHGQFYTPSNVVDFMWRRAIVGRENLLERFVANLGGSQDQGGGNQASTTPSVSESPLVPTALDPCLGVSTFLSCYVRLLIQKARHDHTDTIWNSPSASRLLLAQICENIWGIELDGFAFWMARCGILASLIPLVERVQELHHLQQQNPHYRIDGEEMTKLSRLHLFRNDTLQLTVPDGVHPDKVWERACILQLRDPQLLRFDFIVTNPPYMIRKTGTFSAPDPEVYDWSILETEGSPTVNISSVSPSETSSRSKPRRGSISPNPPVSEDIVSAAEEEYELEESDSEVTTPGSMSTGSLQSSRIKALHSSSWSASSASASMRLGAKGMMQAYGYFIWFAAQRIKPYAGVSCMITASQWLTLEFATKLRAWLFENCLMDEFFQFEPFKVFAKVQTDSLIFKIRSMEPGRTRQDSSVAPLDQSPLHHRLLEIGAHRTVFLRHTDHHRPLDGILHDYMDFFAISPQEQGSSVSIMVSNKTREELSAIIAAPPQPSSSSSTTVTAPTYSFAPMMPSSLLSTFLLSLTQDLPGICSAGTKRVNRLSAVEPLLWHRGPNTNPVYGLVVRMEYAEVMFGEVMKARWFRPAFYWNGKNSPEVGMMTKALHKEGQFWQGRDRLRLSKKEGSPAESYLVPTPGSHRLYGLCMVDKESVKVLREQMEQGVQGAAALWQYLKDVRNHFQPGLASKKRKVSSSGKQQTTDDEGVAYCSTNQCGSDVPEKVVHPINYGYFSKTQPRQRFFLDTSSLAVTNQCIYLTLNKLSHHYDAAQSPPLIYFLTLLNSSTLQFFVLHHCQYDQQGRMRLFRESMAKIPFQDHDVKNSPQRIHYAAQLGQRMIDLKGILYRAVMEWNLTGSNSRTDLGAPRLSEPFVGSTGGNQGLLDWIRRGGDPPTGVLPKTRDQIWRMLQSHASASTTRSPPPTSIAQLSTSAPPALPALGAHFHRAGSLMSLQADIDIDANTGTDTDTDTEDNFDSGRRSRFGQEDVEQIPQREYQHPLQDPRPGFPPQQYNQQRPQSWMSSSNDPTQSSSTSHRPSHPPQSSTHRHAPQSRHPLQNQDTVCDAIMRALERAVTMVEMLQWAVDQYGYMLYGIQPRFQKLLELELRVAYGSRLDAVIANVPSPVSEPLSLPLQHQQPVGPLDHDQPMRSGEEISFGHVEDPTTVPQSGILSTSAPSALYSTPLSPTVPLRPILPRQGSAGTRHTRPPLASQTHAVSAHSPSNLEQDLGITVTELQRWDKSEEEDPASVAVPAYSQSIMENAQAAVSSLEELLRRYPPL